MTSHNSMISNVKILEAVDLHPINSKSEIYFIKDNQNTSHGTTNYDLKYIVTKSASFCKDMGYMKLEVVMFLYMFSSVMRYVSSTVMILEKSCIVHLKYPEEICLNLSNYKDIKIEVEKLANNYSLGHSLIQMIPSSILACFIGAWSDRYGRKIPLIMAFTGVILDGLGSTICAGLFYSRLEFYFLPSIFSGLTGGFIGVLTVVYSYASDTTSFRKRTVKYAIMEVTFGLARPLGTLTGGFIFKYLGYTYVFLISSLGHVLALTWVVFMIKETRGLDNKDNWKKKILSLWSPQRLIESFKATIKKRPNQGRKQILLLIAVMSLDVLSFASTASINYLYVHHQFDWDNTRFSTVSSIFAIVGTTLMLITVPILKKYKIGDPTLGLIGSVSLLTKSIALGLSTTKEIYFFGNAAGFFSGLGILASRSRISKIASKNDIGKIFAFLTTAETFLPILSSAAVSQIFNASLHFFPGLIYLIVAAFLLLPIGVFMWLYRLPVIDYEKLHNNPDGDSTVGVKDEKCVKKEKF